MRYDATVTPLETQALFDLQGPAGALRDWLRETSPGAPLSALPDRPNSARAEGGATLMHLGPEHWILRADLAREAALEAALRPAEAPPALSVVRISDTLSFFRITGSEASEIMAIACPLDLHPESFGPQAASFTAAFGTKALVSRCEGGFDLAVERSFAPYVAEALATATGTG